MTQPAIQVQELTKNYGPVVAVDRINFEVARGELVGFLGNNGAGKSTTMRVLTTFLPASSGYAPTFNPKIEGGFMWVAFFSRRDYGHHLRGSNSPQVWIAAIDANADPTSGLDPSHPGFWLPGQSEASDNLSSFFAPKPCAETGGLCEADAGCCGDGLCRPVCPRPAPGTT